MLAPVLTPMARLLRRRPQQSGLNRILTALYGAGEQGIAVPDLTPGNGFLFQDSAGTTPVTAFEQPVGLILDRSKGLVLGPERVTNGDFSNGATGWTVGAGWAIAGGVATATNANTSLLQTNVAPSPAGKTYVVTLTILTRTAGSIVPQIAGSVVTLTNPGTYTFYLQPTSSDATFYIPGSGFSGTIDNISVRELPGNHIVQATSTKRPTLSARYNLLTYSEDFSNAAWTKTNATPVANAGVAPDFTNTATLVYPTTTGTGRGAYATLSSLQAGSYVGTIYAKQAGLQSIRIIELLGSSVAGVVNLNTGAVSNVLAGYTVTTTSAGGGWWLISVVGTVTSGTRYFQFVITDNAASSTATTNGTDGVLIWRPDLRLTIDTIGQPAYQRVGAATDYDTAGFYPYLRFDGVDDSMATAASVDFSGTAQMTVLHGVTKLSDAATGVVLDYNNFLNAGGAACFGLAAPQQTSPLRYYMFGAATTGATAIQAVDTNASKAAPVTSVATGLANASVPQTVLRVNGQQIDSSAASIGTSNFGAATLNIGQRPNATSFFNGRLYPFFIRGAATDATTIAQVEQFLKARMPVSF